ncbi:MAG: hypothetical protein ACI85U_003072 [Candidatus Promineifilaceae bacterium]
MDFLFYGLSVCLNADYLWPLSLPKRPFCFIHNGFPSADIHVNQEDLMTKRIGLLFGIVAGVLGVMFFSVAIFSTAVVESSADQAVNFSDQRASAEAAALWLVATHQNADGGYSNFSAGADLASSSVGGTADAILGIAATGYNPSAKLSEKQNTPLDYLAHNVSDMQTFAGQTGGQAGKLVMALTAMGQNPRNFHGVDFVAILKSHASVSGELDSNPFNHSLAMLGLVSAQEMVSATAISTLTSDQGADGAWDDGFGTADNVDATALAIMALIGAGESVTSTAVVKGAAFLKTAQTDSASWEYAPSFGIESANSTAMAIQALSAMGEDFYSPTSTWSVSNTTPISALLSFQGTSGAFQVDFGTGLFDDFFATVQAVVGVTGRPFPLPARYEAAKAAIVCLTNIQDTDSAGWAQFGTGAANAAGTSRAIEALAAFGADPVGPTWTISNTTPLNALETFAPSYLTNGGQAGIVTQGVLAAKGDISDFAGVNLPISITQFISTSGAYAPINFGIQAHAEGMLALDLSKTPVDPAAVTLLNENAGLDGLWGTFDETGIAINVLSRVSETLPAGTFASLQAAQLPTGGWQAYGSFSVNSTSEVAQGLHAAGEHPYAPKWSVIVNGRLTSGVDAIMATQAENGCWKPFGGDDAYSITDAILALMLEDADPVFRVYLPLVDMAN